MLAEREEARRGTREGRRREEEGNEKERNGKERREEKLSSSRREEALSQSMNRGPKLSLAPHRVLPRTDLRFEDKTKLSCNVFKAMIKI